MMMMLMVMLMMMMMMMNDNGKDNNRDWPLHIQDNQGSHHQVCNLMMMMTMDT